MDGYYQQQALNNYFRGPARQRGAGFGSLALSVARQAIPFVAKYILPSAKRVGKEFARNMLPEVVDLATGKTTVKKAVKRAATTTAKKQLGGGPATKRKRTSSIHQTSTPRNSRSSKTRHKSTKRTKFDIFKNLPN